MKVTMQLDKKEAKRLKRNMRKIEKAYGKKRMKKLMESKAGVFVESAKRYAPVSNTPGGFHWASFAAGDKGTNSRGRKRSVKIFSGNLRKSIRILKTGRFKRSLSVWIGPKWLRKAKAKSYGKGKSVNAYYARIVEKKFKEFMRPGFTAAAPVYLGLMNNAISGIIKRMNLK